jgi:hypothetical protein
MAWALVVQMWLLTATLEAHLAGRPEPILPGAILSGLIFLGCGGLFLFIHRLDRDFRDEDRQEWQLIPDDPASHPTPFEFSDLKSGDFKFPVRPSRSGPLHPDTLSRRFLAFPETGRKGI